MLYIVKSIHPNIVLGVILASVLFYFVGTVLATLPLLLICVTSIFLSFKLFGYKLS